MEVVRVKVHNLLRPFPLPFLSVLSLLSLLCLSRHVVLFRVVVLLVRKVFGVEERVVENPDEGRDKDAGCGIVVENSDIRGPVVVAALTAVSASTSTSLFLEDGCDLAYSRHGLEKGNHGAEERVCQGGEKKVAHRVDKGRDFGRHARLDRRHADLGRNTLCPCKLVDCLGKLLERRLNSTSPVVNGVGFGVSARQPCLCLLLHKKKVVRLFWMSEEKKKEGGRKRGGEEGGEGGGGGGGGGNFGTYSSSEGSFA